MSPEIVPEWQRRLADSMSQYAIPDKSGEVASLLCTQILVISVAIISRKGTLEPLNYLLSIHNMTNTLTNQPTN